MKHLLTNLIKKTIRQDIDFEITFPPDDKMGHYSTNIAFILAEKTKKEPLRIANELREVLKEKNNNIFERIEVTSPGFINFWLKPEIFHKELINFLKGDFKKLFKNKKEKIQVEFVSANPTGPLTLANGRGGFLGDALANILTFCGYKVEREYYVNDSGHQILVLGKSILAAVGLIKTEEEFYKGDYIKEWAKTKLVAVKKNIHQPLKLGQLAARDFLEKIKMVLEKKAKIKFDRYTSEERHIHRRKLTLKTLAIFKKAGQIYEKDGAIWLRTTNFGDDKDRVLITNNNEPTYFLADASHYLETVKRGFDVKINILGPDHYGYVKRIQAAAKLVGLKKSEVIITQAVRLMRNGQEFKMSKRKGIFVPFEELINQVGLDAARFFMLMTTPTTHLNFDLNLAKEKSMKNPVYYVQYAYVRAGNILKRFKNKNSKIKVTSQKPKLSLLNSAVDLGLMKRLIEFPEVVESIAVNYQVHNLTRYVLELARVFHNFYETERVIDEINELAEARLTLVKAVHMVLKIALALLGINQPRKM